MGIKTIYETKYKQLLIIPAALLIIAIFGLLINFQQTGEFVNKGISLKGGTSISILADITTEEVISQLNYQGELNYRTLSSAGTSVGVIVEIDETDPAKVAQVVKQIEAMGIDSNQINTETIGSALGDSFFKETVRAIIIAFIFMGLVVFAYFRTFIPSIAVIGAALSDIIITLAIIDWMGMKLSTGGIAAFLMLIGYSVDTDILLSAKMVKNKVGKVTDRVYEAMRTGLTMTFTTMVAITVALIFSQSEIITQIMTVLLIGLIVDLVNTWIQNVAILRWYLEE